MVYAGGGGTGPVIVRSDVREEAGCEHGPLSETAVAVRGALSVDSTHRILRLDIGSGLDRRVQFGQVALVRGV